MNISTIKKDTEVTLLLRMVTNITNYLRTDASIQNLLVSLLIDCSDYKRIFMALRNSTNHCLKHAQTLVNLWIWSQANCCMKVIEFWSGLCFKNYATTTGGFMALFGSLKMLFKTNLVTKSADKMLQGNCHLFYATNAD